MGIIVKECIQCHSLKSLDRFWPKAARGKGSIGTCKICCRLNKKSKRNGSDRTGKV